MVMTDIFNMEIFELQTSSTMVSRIYTEIKGMVK